jgi:hypothetical protein
VGFLSLQQVSSALRPKRGRTTVVERKRTEGCCKVDCTRTLTEGRPPEGIYRFQISCNGAQQSLCQVRSWRVC